VVAVTSSAGVVSIYDEEVGQVVAQVAGVGVQPYGITVDQRGNAARLFVSNFGDGRVAVIDLPSLDVPQDARLVAHLGAQQELDPDQGTTVCQENPQ
jgi:DNA-binding beta-propeller fold protein YncE